jgi:hypothetical protein
MGQLFAKQKPQSRVTEEDKAILVGGLILHSSLQYF